MQESTKRHFTLLITIVGLGVLGIAVAWLVRRYPRRKPVFASVLTPRDFLFHPAISPAPPPRPDRGEADPSGCGHAYLRLYQKPTLEITIVFGYKDARPARYVGDRYESALLVSYLLAPCRDSFQACGFQPEYRDGETFTRKISGPDGQPRNVRIRVVTSAAGPDDNENRTDSFQTWRSRHAERTFLDALSSSDIVFYNGHSRDGGGPDFAPPRLKWGHPDYDWYGQTRPGEHDLLQALKKPVRARLLGLFSCASTGHFLREVRKAAPGLATLTNGRLLYYADAMRNLLGALSAIIGQWCPPDLDSALRTKAAGGTTSLIGFFD